MKRRILTLSLLSTAAVLIWLGLRSTDSGITSATEIALSQDKTGEAVSGLNWTQGQRTIVEPAAGPGSSPESPLRSTSSPARDFDGKRMGLEMAIDQLVHCTDPDRFLQAQTLLCASLSTILDAQGEGQPVPGRRERMPFETGYFIFNFNGRTYKFAQGRFPEYDAFMAVFDARNKASQAHASSIGTGIPEAPSGKTQVDDELVSQIVERAQEALRLVTPVAATQQGK